MLRTVPVPHGLTVRTGPDGHRTQVCTGRITPVQEEL